MWRLNFLCDSCCIFLGNLGFWDCWRRISFMLILPPNACPPPPRKTLSYILGIPWWKRYLVCVLLVLTVQQERQTPNQYTEVKKVKSLSCVRLFVTPWTAVPQALLSMGFSARILEWVAISFSRSSRPRGWTQVSSTAGRWFTIYATREVKPVHR